MKNEIIIYQNQDSSTNIEVRIEDETVWLNRHQIATLFDRDVKTIGKHINNIFKEGELVKEVVVAKFSTNTQQGGIKGKVQTTEVEYYNLDVIISVGYRVKSKRGTQFRIWANKILKEYLLKGHVVDRRLAVLEDDMRNVKTKLNEIDFQVKTGLPPNEGIFYNGQVYDAYVFVGDLIKSAKESIILIDNYIDDTVLTMLSKRSQNVSAIIYTGKISKQLSLDIIKHNQQYPPIEIKLNTHAHDRFLIIDNEIIYHIGASLKDLGRKLFAFSRIHFAASELIKKLSNK